MRILLIQYKMLGDVLTSTIIADQLKIIYPDAHLDYLIIAHAGALVAHHPAIDNLIKVTKSDFEKMSFIISLSRKLKHNKYDLLIDAYGKNNSAVLSLLSRAKQRIGYKKWFSRLAYTDAVKNIPNSSIYKAGIALGSRMLLTTPLTSDVQWHLKPQIYLKPTEKTEGEKWLLQSGIDLKKSLTMVSVLGSSTNKTLPFTSMAKVLDNFVNQTGSQLLFNYIPSQKKDALAIYNTCSITTQKHIFIDAFAPSIRDFVKILSHCTSIIGNEGGAINMGKALNIPTFAIFSPWINKASWNISEDGKKHISVHLQDYLPELYKNSSPGNMKSQAMELYQQFDTELMFPNLEKFIEENY
ncbi:glycosyltransferase family 9 protein [uncultured Nonlabens sp.]|uniref:glycosyltransferase family 9 protein n=1 Tax=uncultured Nonlabens sp. TaxID=859306 RepID=UPI0026190B18|nr:glycosyltransferase family 9 protein [uncultured Nonlabens sp.]